MLRNVEIDGEIAAIIIYSSFQCEGINFVTPSSFSQQLGYMKRESGYLIEPHMHNINPREVSLTNEVLFVKSGVLRVDFYNNNKVYFGSVRLKGGDVILLAAGGHGFLIEEDSEIIEVKQGPYSGDADKTRFVSKIDVPTMI